MFNKINWDGAGIFASIACAIHCAILPLLSTGISLAGIEILHNPWFEWGMILLTLLIGSYALQHGYRTHHRNTTPFLIFFAGFVCLVLKQFFHTLNIVFLSIAVTAIISAHLYNFRLCQKTKCASPHHKH
jgi:ABC-type iron transport system FetAB permease component